MIAILYILAFCKALYNCSVRIKTYSIVIDLCAL